MKRKDLLRISTVLIGLLLAFSVSAQKKVMSNLGAFDSRLYHFGVQLSINTADFYLQSKFDPGFENGVVSLENIKQPGFNIAIIASLNLNKNVSLRFIPGISPKERILNYTIRDDFDRDRNYEKVISSFYIDMPLLLKYRTDRINNFAAYVIAGGQYSRDMSSQEKVKNELAGLDEQVVKIKKGDFLLNVGGGVDFFLPYFKFGLELKLGYGLKNLLINDGTIFSDPLQDIRSKNFVFSLTFEG